MNRMKFVRLNRFECMAFGGNVREFITPHFQFVYFHAHTYIQFMIDCVIHIRCALTAFMSCTMWVEYGLFLRFWFGWCCWGGCKPFENIERKFKQWTKRRNWRIGFTWMGFGFLCGLIICGSSSNGWKFL